MSRKLLSIALILSILKLASCADYDDYCIERDDRLICNDHDMKEIPDDIPSTTKSLVIVGTPAKQFEIHRLRRLEFQKLSNLEELFVVFAQVTTIEPDTFHDLKQLKRLDLKSNKIKTIDKDTFKGLDDLELINLSGNEYCDIQIGAFSNLPSLLDLYLSAMNIRNLNPTSFAGLDSLLHLDLAGNDIRQLDKGILEPLKNLVSLDISNNRIKGLDKDMEKSINKLTSISLGNNPWQCNCDMEWFKTLPTKFIYDTVSFSSDRVVVCEGPEELQFRDLVDIPKSELVCTVPLIKDCKPISVYEGDTGKISCRIDGDPFPTVTWTLPGGASISSSEDLLDNKDYSMTENGTLVIAAVKLSQKGEWKIEVENEKGSDSATVKVNVTQKASPAAEPKSDKGLLIGACAGGAVALLCIIIITAVCCKNKKNKVNGVERPTAPITTTMSA